MALPAVLEVTTAEKVTGSFTEEGLGVVATTMLVPMPRTVCEKGVVALDWKLGSVELKVT